MELHHWLIVALLACLFGEFVRSEIKHRRRVNDLKDLIKALKDE